MAKRRTKARTAVTRTTVSVPVTVKSRMDQFEDVNWSAVAVDAFEDKLAEMSARFRIRSIEDVVIRLRASKRNTESRDFGQGEAMGRDWAMNKAAFAELFHLAEFNERLFSRDRESWCVATNPAYSLAENLAFSIRPEIEGERSESRRFWEQDSGADEPSVDNPEFIEGFINGAIAVWMSVRDRL